MTWSIVAAVAFAVALEGWLGIAGGLCRRTDTADSAEPAAFRRLPRSANGAS